MQRLCFLGIMFFSLFSFCLCADEEASNRVYVKSSRYGHFYAKSIPHEHYGLKGVTQIYQVTEKEDVLLHTYDWFAPEIYLDGFLGTNDVYVIQMGPWQRGHEASAEHHGIALYKNGKLLKKYSTLDLVADPKNVSSTRSHYTLFSKIQGFQRPYGNQLIFQVERQDGKILSFDTETGALVTEEEQKQKKEFYDVSNVISQIKWKWYQLNQKKEGLDVNKMVITEAMLKEVAAPNEFPKIPAGYVYVPDTMWQQVSFKKKE